MLKAIDVYIKYKEEKVADLCMNMEEMYDMCEPETWCPEVLEEELDDMTGEVLDSKMVKKDAMQEELSMFKEMGVEHYQICQPSACSFQHLRSGKQYARADYLHVRQASLCLALSCSYLVLLATCPGWCCCPL